MGEWVSSGLLQQFGPLAGIASIIAATIIYVLRFLDRFTNKLEDQNKKYEDRISDLEEDADELRTKLNDKDEMLWNEKNKTARLKRLLISEGIEIPESLQ